MAIARDADCRSRVMAILSGDLHLIVPSSDTDLVAAGVLDSLGLVELIGQLERRFGITIPFEDMDVSTFRSVDAVVEYVTAHLARVSG